MPQSLLNALGTAFDLILVILGFSAIIFFHELGHFLAARWAKIRVLAFAIGFGPALFSYRKGLGFRRGSSAAEVQKIAEKQGLARAGRPPVIPGISPTEYRWNVLPFGGYVKMLGQEDADPTARSDEPDGYQSAPVWKRMIVISSGVVANFILAAVLFVVVFMLGLPAEPAVVGGVVPGSPAATTVATNATELSVTEPGLKAGDRILSVNGDRPDDFSEVIVGIAMSRKGTPVKIEVERPNIDEPLVFSVTPREDSVSKLLQIGVAPAVSGTIASAPKEPEIQARILEVLAKSSLGEVKPGMKVVQVGDNTAARSAHAIDEAAKKSNGAPFGVTFATLADPSSKKKYEDEVTVQVQPIRRLPQQNFWASKDRLVPVGHILGLTPVLGVDELVKDGAAAAAGMLPGDVFAQVGSIEWPSVPEGIAEILQNAGKKVRVVVVREEAGAWKEVDLGQIAVSPTGQIGFYPDDSRQFDTRVTAWPQDLVGKDDSRPTAGLPPATELKLLRGSRILRVNGAAVANFDDIAAALLKAAGERPTADMTVNLDVELPARPGEKPIVEELAWAIPGPSMNEMRELGWSSPISLSLFEPERITLQAAGPPDAVAMGLRRTQRVMAQTYLTFSRLWQGSVKVEHLKGPVGIAHLGTIVASQGFVSLLFFLALISVNLGVVNFLPIPIADGGHFVFLLYEQITGKPVSVAVQNIAALAGLILIAGMFLLVTYNDFAQLLGG